MSSRILILFAHPAFEKSRMNRHLLRTVEDLDAITLVDLYEVYPDFAIDVAAEQTRLLEHDLIVFQHPFFWYSTPALLKEWQDLVLEYGFAYGPKGDRLRGKRFLSVITTGGPEEAYSEHGYNRFTVRQLLAPLEQTASLCGMQFEDPFVVFGVNQLTRAQMAEHAARYRERMLGIIND